MFTKKQVPSIILILIIAVSILLCAYALITYKGNTAQTGTVQNSFTFNQGDRPEFNREQSPLNAENATPGRNNRQNGTNNLHDRQPGNFQNTPGENFRQNINNSNNSNVSISLVVYSLVFMAAFILVSSLFMHKKISLNINKITLTIAALMAIGLLLRIAGATLMTGHPFDINTFKSWSSTAANNLMDVYSSGRTSDYPPFYMYILFAIGKLASVPSLNKFYYILLKLPSMLADIATAYLIFKLAKKYISDKASILLAAFYIFNPAILINSTFWGQVDSFFTFLVVLSVYLLTEKKMVLSAVFFTVGVLMKPQGIIFLPVLFFEIVRQKKLGTIMKVFIPAVLTAFTIILPFALNKGITWIFSLFAGTVGEYRYASVNAFNFFSLLGANYTDDSKELFILDYHTWGMIFIVAVTLFSWFIYIKGRDSKYAPVAALILMSGVFTFSSRMHERYLFPVVALVIFAYIYLKDKRFIVLAGGFSITVFVNTYYILFSNNSGIEHFDPVLMIVSFMNVVLFAYLAKVSLDLVNKKKVEYIGISVDNFIE